MKFTEKNSEDDFNLAEELRKRRNKNIVLVLKPEQINILGQVFRPILSRIIV